MASDSLNENYTTVVIHLKDANDLPPVFNENIYTKTIDEEFPDIYPLRLIQVRLNNISATRKIFTLIPITVLLNKKKSSLCIFPQRLFCRVYKLGLNGNYLPKRESARITFENIILYTQNRFNYRTATDDRCPV